MLNSMLGRLAYGIAPATVCAAGLAASWSTLQAAPRFKEDSEEYEAAKAFFEGKHAVPLEGYPPREPALSPEEFRSFTLESVTEVSPDTKRLRFTLPDSKDSLGLTVASCLVAKADIDGKTVVRPYTPTTPASQLGYFELVVKGYPEGNVSKHLTSLEPGAAVEMKGPFKKFEYVPNSSKAIGMIAGGSGITPMYQLLLKILSNPRDNTEVRLLYGNKTASDVLLKDELDALATLYPNFKVYYTVDSAEDDWEGFTGHVNKSMVASTLPPPSDDHKILVCGPPGMLKAVSGPLTEDYKQGELAGLLKDMGYSSSGVFKF